jgi:tRNA-intron endonuclease
MKLNFFKKTDFGNFPIFISNTRIFSNSKKAIDLFDSKKIGEFSEGKITYSPYEAIFLVEKERARLFENEKEISLNSLIKKLSKKTPELITNYILFKDLRKKGFVVKTDLKFGTEFRIYKKSEKHAKWISFAIQENEKLNLKDFIAKNRIAHSTAKKLLIAIIDSQENINYFETDWLKLK